MPLKAKKTSNLRRDNVLEGTKATARRGNAAKDRKMDEKKKGVGPPAKSTDGTAQSGESHRVPLDLQQRVLDNLQDVSSASLNDQLLSVIQELKQHLFDRNFTAAFGKSLFLDAYAARWSPTRALAYLEILSNLSAIGVHNPPSLQLGNDTGVEHEPTPEKSVFKAGVLPDSLGVSRLTIVEQDVKNSCNPRRRQRVVCLGAGGGAELLSLAGCLHQVNPQAVTDKHVADSLPMSLIPVDVVLVDIADWSSLFRRLYSSVTASQKNDSPDLRRDEPPLINSSVFSTAFVQRDILGISMEDLNATVGDASLVTMMFTLNELYNSCIVSTTKLLLSLTSLLQPGALLLVVDSPGSYSTVGLGTPETGEDHTKIEKAAIPHDKRYPMKWLLDHTLLETASISDTKAATERPIHQWEKVDSEDSRWFRLPPELKYPIKLEDMRYQMHLYRRL